MDILLVRHAKATEKGGMADPYRPLTAKGRRDALVLGDLLRAADVKLDAIITSPLVRAVETASLVAVGLHYTEGLDVEPELSPTHPAEAVLEEVLLPRADLGSLAIVGHEPQLGLLLRLLLKGYAPSLRKAVAVRVRWDGPDTAGKFEWVLHPDLKAPSKNLEDI